MRVAEVLQQVIGSVVSDQTLQGWKTPGRRETEPLLVSVPVSVDLEMLDPVLCAQVERKLVVNAAAAHQEGPDRQRLDPLRGRLLVDPAREPGLLLQRQVHLDTGTM